MTSSAQASTSQGWTCASCGGFVPHGATHFCQPVPVGDGYRYRSFPAPAADPMWRVAAALERIATALEAKSDAS